MFEFSRKADQQNVCKPFKIWDEKPIFNYLEPLTNLIHSSTGTVIGQYVQLLFNLVRSPVDCAFSDLLNRQALTQLIKISFKEKLEKEQNKEIQQKVTQIIKGFIRLITDKNYAALHRANIKNMNPLWLHSLKLFLELAAAEEQTQDQCQQMINALHDIFSQISAS